jgi:Domain of unknown function (DUF5673)
MIWALLAIPVLIALLLIYAINRSMLGKQAAFRNLLNSLLFLPLTACMVGIFFLPEPWRNYTSIALFTTVSVLFWIQLLTTTRRKKQAGYLLWHLGWPVNHKYMLLASTLFLIMAILQTVVLIILASQGFSGSSFSIEYYLAQVILYWSGAFYCLWVGFSKLELREKGIYFKFGLVKWQQIASYKWEGEQANILTVWLKQSIPFFNTRSWLIPAALKNPVERVIVQNMSSQAKINKGYPY